jgi:hypothetical protein
MNKTRTRILMFTLLTAMAGVPGLATAESRTDDETLDLTRAVIQVERREIFAKTLNLGPEESEIFWPLYDAYSSEVGLVKERQLVFVTDYVNSYESLTDEMAMEFLDRWLDLEQASLKIRREWVKRFTKELPATTVARFFQLDNRMNAIIRAELAQLIPALR